MNDPILTLPKAHLHLHLFGSARETTIRELAKEQGIAIHHNLQNFDNLQDFLACYSLAKGVIKHPEHLKRLCWELVEDESNEMVTYLEPCINPFTSARQLGTSPEYVLDLVIDTLRAAGDAFGTYSGLMIALDRHASQEESIRLAEFAAKHAGNGVVSLGIAGDESAPHIEKLQRPCSIAREAGLLIVPHAGEICGPESVWNAVKLLGADRIAHGVRAAEDPTLLSKLAREQITCDVCLTSNLMLNIYPDISQHSLPHLLDAGIPVSLNCDDKLFFKSEISQEYNLAKSAFGLGFRDLASIARASIKGSGAPQKIKESTLRGIDQWEQINIQ